MINRKIAMSAMSIVTALSLMGGATFAFFSDEGTSSSNSFSTGSLDLQLANEGDPFTDTVTATFGDTDMAPGDCTTEQVLRFDNTGSVAGNHLDITGTNTNAPMASFLRIGSLTYDSGDVLSKIPDDLTDSNTFVDLLDLEVDTDGIEDLAMTDFDEHNIGIVVCLDESAESDLESQTNTLDLTVTLFQGSHASH